ncbi:MAG: dihydropteroate synthase [Lachnospiraceae bacterium]|nr:dihydropteroate synthase [Lachnospiraceae bacterium]
MIVGNKVFESGHTYVMGILNVTPDSFSDGGKFNVLDNALRHIEEMINDGADIIDIGGESTRPGYERIGEQEEIERIAPVFEAAAKRFDIPFSIDTYKPEVAGEAVKLGALLINDIWGLKGENLTFPDSGMAKVIADSGVACCIMHNRNLVENELTGSDIVSSVISDLTESLEIASKYGIPDDKILLDPGIGFGKTYEENIACIKHLEEICKAFEYPMLLGTSRKSVIGLTLNLDKSERMEGTLATTARAVESGCMFVRVHDVKENARFIKMLEAVR